MGERSLIDDERLAHIRFIVRAIYDALVDSVIANIKELPDDCRTSSDDSGLANVWEEFKYQMQREQCYFFEAYELTLQSYCIAAVKDLSREQQGLLWLWSDAYLDWDDDDGKIPCGDPIDEALQKELYRHVCIVACNEELANDPDVERDRAED